MIWTNGNLNIFKLNTQEYYLYLQYIDNISIFKVTLFIGYYKFEVATLIKHNLYLFNILWNM